MGDLRANAIVSGRRERDLIAVIDDDPFVLEAMAGLLRKWGYEVLTAATDRAALDTFDERRRPPDLIVCDYHLSNGLTGIEAIERLRNAFRIPAFLITGDAALAELPQAGALGVRGVLQVETRGPFKGPRAYDASGLPLHFDNQSVFMERILLDRADPNILHDPIVAPPGDQAHAAGTPPDDQPIAVMLDFVNPLVPGACAQWSGCRAR
jgi:CheY-like chemotaxis protein